MLLHHQLWFSLLLSWLSVPVSATVCAAGVVNVTATSRSWPVDSSGCRAHSPPPPNVTPPVVSAVDWNAAASGSVAPPAIVYFCRSQRDVECAISDALAHNRTLAVRSGRHSYTAFSVAPNSAVIDVSNLTTIAFDAARQTVTVGAGARLFDVYDRLAAQQQMFAGGTCPTVGMGYVLGGGYGFQARLLGMASDTLTQAHLVVAPAGGVPRGVLANSTANSDLFWALRGGGNGNFGVVTSLTLRTARAPSLVTHWRISFPANATAAALTLYDKLVVSGLPDYITAQFTIYPSSSAVLFVGLCAPGVLKQRVHARSWQSFFDATFGPLRSMTFLESVVELAGCGTLAQCRTMTASAWPSPSAPLRFDATSLYAAVPLSNSPHLSAVLASVAAQPAALHGAFGGIIVDQYGGAIARTPAGATAFPHRAPLYHLQVMSYWSNATQTATARQWLANMVAATAPTATMASYRNYPSLTWANANQRYFQNNLARLRAIKQKVDPQNRFQYAQSL